VVFGKALRVGNGARGRVPSPKMRHYLFRGKRLAAAKEGAYLKMGQEIRVAAQGARYLRVGVKAEALMPPRPRGKDARPHAAAQLPRAGQAAGDFSLQFNFLADVREG